MHISPPTPGPPTTGLCHPGRACSDHGRQGRAQLVTALPCGPRASSSLGSRCAQHLALWLEVAPESWCWQARPLTLGASPAPASALTVTWARHHRLPSSPPDPPPLPTLPAPCRVVTKPPPPRMEGSPDSGGGPPPCPWPVPAGAAMMPGAGGWRGGGLRQPRAHPAVLTDIEPREQAPCGSGGPGQQFL